MTPWTVAHQAPLSVGFPRQEYWSGLPSPEDLPDPGIKPASPALHQKAQEAGDNKVIYDMMAAVQWLIKFGISLLGNKFPLSLD